MPQPQVSDENRRRFEEALAAAILARYLQARRQAGQKLENGAADVPQGNERAVVAGIVAFARDRGAKVQDGINSRIESTLAGLPADATDTQKRTALASLRADIDAYHDDVLVPYIGSWSDHKGLLDTYTDTPGTESGKTAADETLWTWQQVSDFEDDCMAADGMSPAPLAELQSLTGVDMPPAHSRCRCTLNPV